MFQATELRSCLLLQMLLEANVYVSAFWAVNYLLYIVVHMDQLWSFDTLGLLLAYVLAVGSEIVRLHATFAVNLRPENASMWLLLTVTPCVLFPSMVYLRLSLGDDARLWPHSISYAVLALIGLEVIAILVHNISNELDETNRQLADVSTHQSPAPQNENQRTPRMD
ncbi:uncharacterized protein LOC108158667 [Drosophila miranda]|uniref:uncharacterized protein LOC108158667 n=1 Tax=Drosophila miranda TaxID=7229 RepID=UPI0007E817F8|nr:uncharacterized protein LOC108158667 [Drosophila miranda]